LLLCVLLHVKPSLCLTFLYFSIFLWDVWAFDVYSLSLHDALPIYDGLQDLVDAHARLGGAGDRVGSVDADHVLDLGLGIVGVGLDRKSTRLNSSHVKISYAVFCLKKNTINNLDIRLGDVYLAICIG